MAKVSVSKTIKAPADKVWAMISEWDGTHKWIPGVGPVTVEGNGIGSTRSADLDPATGFPRRITESLESFDEDAMHFSYKVVGQSPLPITDYLAVMKIAQQGSDSCEVTWESTWEATGALSEAELVAAFEGLYGLSLENVCQACE